MFFFYNNENQFEYQIFISRNENEKKNKSHLYGKCVYFPFRNNGKPIFYEVFFLQIDEYIYI
jgi:hypothetical protein